MTGKNTHNNHIHVLIVNHNFFLPSELISVRCEAFSTYPRTYDLLHVDSLFTSESHR